MTIDTEHDGPQTGGAGFSDALTFSWGDGDDRLFGFVRVELGGAGATSAAVLFVNDKVMDQAVQGPAPADAAGGWDAIDLAGVHITTSVALETWQVLFEARDGKFDLRFDALSAPLEMAPALAQAAGGANGYEQLCRVTGSVWVRGRKQQVRCFGQRSRQWGVADHKKVQLARSVSFWISDSSAFTLTTVRGPRAHHHIDEAMSAWLVRDGEPLAVAETLLSTAYDADGRQRRAGLELWPDPEAGYAHRAAGDVLCATTTQLGALSLDSAFFEWRMEGHTGVGRYDVLRPA